MNQVIQINNFTTSGKTAFKESYLNDGSISIPSPYARMLYVLNRNDHKQALSVNRSSLTDDYEKDNGLIDLNLKTISSYLLAFQLENVLIDPEKVRNFLLTNKGVFGKLTKLVTLALADYQDLIEGISLRILSDDSGKQELILVEFNLNEDTDVDHSIEIDDNFKQKNPNLSSNLINFDFV